MLRAARAYLLCGLARISGLLPAKSVCSSAHIATPTESNRTCWVSPARRPRSGFLDRSAARAYVAGGLRLRCTGAGEAGEAGGGGGGGGFDFGVDPNLDPELALALRVSLEEERARLGAGVMRSSGSQAAVAGPTLYILCAWRLTRGVPSDTGRSLPGPRAQFKHSLLVEYSAEDEHAI